MDVLTPSPPKPSPPGLLSPLEGKEAWNYVEVRDGAHMFWWLYYADNQSAGYKDLPLVMWLQVRLPTTCKKTCLNLAWFKLTNNGFQLFYLFFVFVVTHFTSVSLEQIFIKILLVLILFITYL